MSAAAYQNRIFGHSATELVAALNRVGRNTTVTFRDKPYYFLRVDELRDDPGGVNPYEDINATGWYSIVIDHDVSGPIEQELLFLNDMGLAMQVDDTGEYLINPIVDTILYGPSGFFNTATAAPNSEENFRDFLRTTVLPGYLSLYRYMTRGIYNNTWLHEEGQRAMRDITETLAMLNARI